MSKKQDSTELATVDQAMQVPDYLRTETPLGIEPKGELRVTPRVKIIQAMTKRELKDEFGEGVAILGDSKTLICDAEGLFTGIIVFKYPTWEKMKDANDKSTDNPVVEMSTDPNSELRAKARGRVTEPYGNGFRYEYVESLNYVVEITDGPAAVAIALLAYNKGSHEFGRRINSLYDRTRADVFAAVWKFTSKIKTNTKNQTYWVLEPSFKGWVKADDLPRLKELYGQFEAMQHTAVASAEVGDAQEPPF